MPLLTHFSMSHDQQTQILRNVKRNERLAVLDGMPKGFHGLGMYSC